MVYKLRNTLKGRGDPILGQSFRENAFWMGGRWPEKLKNVINEQPLRMSFPEHTF